MDPTLLNWTCHSVGKIRNYCFNSIFIFLILSLNECFLVTGHIWYIQRVHATGVLTLWKHILESSSLEKVDFFSVYEGNTLGKTGSHGFIATFPTHCCLGYWLGIPWLIPMIIFRHQKAEPWGCWTGKSINWSLCEPHRVKIPSAFPLHPQHLSLRSTINNFMP